MPESTLFPELLFLVTRTDSPRYKVGSTTEAHELVGFDENAR